LCPDGDFFDAIEQNKATIVTDHIDHFTQSGVALASGEHIQADIVVTATGLKMLFLGGIQLMVDGQEISGSELFIYKGFMCNNIPNMFASIGYTNASWTLKVDLSNQYACRLIDYMQKNNYQYCKAEVQGDGFEEAPLLNLTSGYVHRSATELPQQGSKAPWRLYQNYILDMFSLKHGAIKDGTMQFFKTR